MSVATILFAVAVNAKIGIDNGEIGIKVPSFSAVVLKYRSK